MRTPMLATPAAKHIEEISQCRGLYCEIQPPGLHPRGTIYNRFCTPITIQVITRLAQVV
jgi:hypothetical protein